MLCKSTTNSPVRCNTRCLIFSVAAVSKTRSRLVDACGAQVADKLKQMSSGSICPDVLDLEFTMYSPEPQTKVLLWIVHGWSASGQSASYSTAADASCMDGRCSRRQQRSPLIDGHDSGLELPLWFPCPVAAGGGHCPKIISSISWPTTSCLPD